MQQMIEMKGQSIAVI